MPIALEDFQRFDSMTLTPTCPQNGQGFASITPPNYPATLNRLISL